MSRVLAIAFKGDLSKLREEFARNPESALDHHAFGQAIGWDKTPIVKEFIAKGADPNLKSRNGLHPLNTVCIGHASLETLEVLLTGGSAPDQAPELPFNAALMARIEVVRRLWEIGVDFSKSGDAGLTPLAFAASMGREDVVDFLIEKRAAFGGLDSSKPIRPWKGCAASGQTLERIRVKLESYN